MQERIIDPEYRSRLLGLADEVCSRLNISRSYLGVKIVNDADFLHNLAAGSGCRADTLVKAEQYLKREIGQC